MKTKCMSCGGPTKKMQAGGTLPKAQKGAMIKSIIKPFAKKVVKKITKPTTPKMELGGSLEKAQNGGTTRNARTGKHTGGPLSCFEKAKRTNKNRKFWHSGGGKTIKNIGKTALGAATVVGAGAVAYKKNSKFKGAVDELKGKLGFNQKGGIVKKYQNGGPTDSLKIIKKEGKLAVKTEKQKQAAAKKAAALAKKIAKAKENARLNLEWERMSESQKDSVIRQQRSRF
jgi:hypothetical protein